jgi:hypothetical protein
MIEVFQSSEFAKAKLNTLRPRFRYHVAALAMLACVTFTWTAFFDIRHDRGMGGFVFGIGAVAIALVLVTSWRREREILRDYVPTIGSVIESKKRRRATEVTYQFVAFDGKKYESQSAWSIEGLKRDQEVTVLYKTLNPELSMVLRGFVFYSFSSEDESISR